MTGALSSITALWIDPVMSAVFGVALIGGFARGLAGFGVGLIMMPICASVIGPAVTIPMMALIDAPTATWLASKVWRDFDRREVLTLLIACAGGTPVGIAVLLLIEPDVIKNIASVIVLFFAVALLFGLKLGGEPSTRRSTGTGFVAGVLEGSVGLPGPPIILVWLATQVPGARLRANIIMFFFGMMLIVVPAFTIAGLMTAETILMTAAVFPFFFGGVLLGNLASGHVPEAIFRKIVLGLVSAGAISALLT